MSRNFLIGPVSDEFARSHLPVLTQSGACKAFDWQGTKAISIDRLESWDEFRSLWVPGWSPDFCVLVLPYVPIPKWIWQAPVPIIGLAKDWNLHWSCYRDMLPSCDLVVTDIDGCRRFAQEGFEHVRPGVLYGSEAYSSEPDFTNRDIDIGFAGNLNRVIQQERSSWLLRLARMGDRWNVGIRTKIFGDEYRSFLRRCKIVFNRSVRGEWNMRVGEALQAGALLLQEESNAEVRERLFDRVDCVFYNDRNLEELVDYYLRNQEDRIAIARAGWKRSSEFTFERFWSEIQKTIDAEWLEVMRRCASRRERIDSLHLKSRVWQSISTDLPRDRDLAPDLAWKVAGYRDDAEGHFLQAVLYHSQSLRSAAIKSLEKATLLDPGFALADLNRLEILAETKAASFEDDVSQFLNQLMTGTDGIERFRDLPHLPPKFDEFRIEWEKAAWSHVDDPAQEFHHKRALLAWRAHALRGIFRRKVEDFQAAAAQCPEVALTQRLLGQGLLETGRAAESILSLRAAWNQQPFSIAAARLLCEALEKVRDLRGARTVARDARLLAKACPSVAREAWFENAVLVGNELTTIILVCRGPVEVAKRTITSILRASDTPFELIAIVRGSTQIAEELQTIAQNARRNPCLRRTEFAVSDPTAVPLANALEGALRGAEGTYLTVLHGNVQLTQGWLSRLIDWSLVNYPKIGLVGPESNRTLPPQQAPSRTASVEEIEQFGRERRRQFVDKGQLVSELNASCLMTRRDVLKTTGEEQAFGRLLADPRRAVGVSYSGFDHILARDVYVHFEELAVVDSVESPPDPPESREAVPMRPPWDAEVSRVPPRDSATSPLGDGISLCMIVKNEEANLAACLKSVADLVDELIIVDTGSTDSTKAIARSFGAKVYDFPWIDDFAAARNESIRHATRRWIFWMDADDRLDAANREAFRSLRPLLRSQTRGFVMKCLCLPDESGAATLVDHVRLFPNHPTIRWRYRVHEQILGSIRDHGGDVDWTKVIIHHTGYQNPELRTKKRARDMQILVRENEERPDDAFTLFNMGQVLHELGRIDEALRHLQRSLEVCPPNASIVRKLYALIARIHRSRQQNSEAMRLSEEAVQRFPDDPELAFQMALCHQDQGNVESALQSYLQILRMPEADYFASCDPSLRTFKTHHNIAVLYRDVKKDDLAEFHFDKALSYSPEFIPSLNGLADLYIAQGRWNNLAAVVSRLRAIPAAVMTAEIAEARRDLAIGEPRKSLSKLEAIHARYPSAVSPLIYLGHVLIQLEEWTSAEKVSRQALQLNPHEPEARRILDTVLGRQCLTAATDRPRISLCMIVRNEGRHLARCLRSTHGLVDETIVVDTGSADRTREVARELGARVIEIRWSDSFAEARNRSLDAARGKWIFYLDADEFLDETNRSQFRSLAGTLSTAFAYLMKQVSVSRDSENETWTVDQVRLFPNLPGIRWTYRVHEQILPALRRHGCTTKSTDIQIRHEGFADREARDKKVRRNIELLIHDVRENPNNGFVQFNLASAYFDIGDDAKAIEAFAHSVHLCQGRASFVPRALKLQLASLRRMNRLDEALARSEQFLRDFPGDQELLLEQGIIFAALGRNVEARDCFTQTIASSGAGITLGRSRDALASSARCHLAELEKAQVKPQERP